MRRRPTPVLRLSEAREPIGPNGAKRVRSSINHAFERQLRLGVTDGDRVVAGEAGVAVPVVRSALAAGDGAHHPVERQEGEAVGADVFLHLLHRLLCGHQVTVVAHVDAEVAGVGDRRAGDPQMYLCCSRIAHELHERPGGRATHQRVVDHDDPLALEVLRQRVELECDATLAVCPASAR